jgi:hypothetical protein
LRWGGICLALLLLLGAQAGAQIPRINTLYPIGGKAGTTVEVELRGANLAGADMLLVNRPGVSGTVEPGGAKPDETNKPLWQQKCGLCHELRSPANRSMTSAQWTTTVERMVKVNRAPLSPAEQEKVTQYLVSAARAGQVTARLTIAPNAPPGLYEVRAVTPRGVSTASLFEVESLPEAFAVNGTRDRAQPVMLPCIVNGCFAMNGERHFYRFTAKKGERYVFSLKGFRYNASNQMFFNPDLRLYDADGRELAENHGYYELDPLMDWTCPSDGSYVLEARDLLGRGNPASVYRLTLASVAANAPLDPPDAPTGPARPPSPLECVARPDNITLRPGLSTAVEVILTRRDGIQGDVQVTAEGLPPGVTAAPAVIQPDRYQTWLILTAAPDARPLAQPFRIVATGRGPKDEVKTEAVPQEIYRLNNEPRAVDRTQCVVAVCGQPEFTASYVGDAPIKVHRRLGNEVPVAIQRRNGFKGAVTVRLTGLPQGWTANWETVPPDKSVATLLVRPDGNDPNPFLKRDPKLTPIRPLLEAFSDEFVFAFGTKEAVKDPRPEEEDKPGR